MSKPVQIMLSTDYVDDNLMSTSAKFRNWSEWFQNTSTHFSSRPLFHAFALKAKNKMRARLFLCHLLIRLGKSLDGFFLSCTQHYLK